MITKIENAICLCVEPKKWEIKAEGKSGISYKALIYSNKKVNTCKTDEDLYNKLKDKELIKGTAVIEIEETNYNNKLGIQYILKEFGQ